MRALSPHKKNLLTQWRHELGHLRLDFDSALPSEVDLWNTALRVPEMSFPAFRGMLERVGEDLARSGVPLDQLVAVMNSLLEAGLQYLIEDKSPFALAVLRLNGVARYLLISAYSRQQETRMHMIEAQLSEAEHRLHGASAYVTNVYEQERRRLSHDLHDDIGHDLVMLKLHLEVLAGDVEQGKLSSLLPRLNDARTIISHTIESVRRLVLDLGPAVFDDLGFVPALKFYARRFSSTTRIAVSVQEGELPAEVPMSHQTALYRVLQGALSNVVKHSHAKHVKVALASLKNSALVMTIEDDGAGFDAEAPPLGRRFGLTAMRERIAVLGGRVHVQSWRAGPLGGRHGTRIEVDLPLPGGQKTS
jgi:signal transduction histidine kinase